MYPRTARENGNLVFLAWNLKFSNWVRNILAKSTAPRHCHFLLFLQKHQSQKKYMYKLVRFYFPRHWISMIGRKSKVLHASLSHGLLWLRTWPSFYTYLTCPSPKWSNFLEWIKTLNPADELKAGARFQNQCTILKNLIHWIQKFNTLSHFKGAVIFQEIKIQRVCWK